MSNIYQSEVWKTVNVSAGEMLLLIACADICDDAGNNLWASDEYLQWKTGLPPRTIQALKKKWRASGALVPVGFIHLQSKQTVLCDVKVRQGTGGRGWAVLYRLVLNPFPKKEPWKLARIKKVAIAATFNDGEKVAADAAKGRNGVQQKAATAASEGRNSARCNKEVELLEELPHTTPTMTTAATERFPVELAARLRDIEPALDDRAIEQIWLKSRANALDCTVDEVVYFAWTKASALERATSPAGLLIVAVPQCFEGEMLARWRESQRAAQEAEARRLAEAEEHERQMREWLTDERRIQADGERRLAALRAEDRQALEAKILRDLAKHPTFPNWSAEGVQQSVRVAMIRELGTPKEDAMISAFTPASTGF